MPRQQNAERHQKLNGTTFVGASVGTTFLVPLGYWDSKAFGCMKVGFLFVITDFAIVYWISDVATATELSPKVCGYFAFGRNTRDLGSFGEETDKTTDLQQNIAQRNSPQKWERRHSLPSSQRFPSRRSQVSRQRHLYSIFSLCYLCRNPFSSTTIGDENPIRTLGDYSKPSHEGYRNTIELPVGNNVVPLRSDTIRLVQNGCSFHGLRSENPNQHLKDFLKLVDSLDLEGKNRERKSLCLFQISFRDQASNWLERLPAGSITTWEDLTTRFLAQFFPPGRTAKLRNDIRMFQQHHGESLSKAWTRFKDLLQKVPHHGIDRWLQIQKFYDHVSFHLKCEIDRAAGDKLHNTNAEESWEIIKNLALYDHEGWNDTKEFVKPVKAISTPQGISKTPDRRLLELEDQINFLQKGSRPTLRSSTHIPHAYADAVYSNPRLHEHNEPPKLNSFSFRECTCPSPQPQALGTTFEARVRDYMAAHTERMERFENAIFKQREEINDRMTEMFGLLKELTTNRTPEKLLIREEAKFPVTKNVNSISLARGEEERTDKTDERLNNTIKPTVIEMEIPVNSRPVEYYLKHRINEKLIEGLVDNNRFNDSLSRARVGKVKGKTYNVLPRGPVYEAILKKKITKKEDIEGNFEIPCSIGGLKHVNALVDLGSDVNVMPYSTYMKLTDERPAETDIRLSLASHSYIYPLGIVEDVLVEVAEHVYPVDFVILDIKENKKRPFILGTPFLTMAKATIKFDKGTITLRSGKSKASPGMGRKDKASLGKGDEVQPMEEQKF
ncbi:zinc finger, CCHC-type containing protein [Tanacetum coccineum]